LKALQKQTSIFLVIVRVQYSGNFSFPILCFSTIREISFLLRKTQFLFYMIW